MNLKRLTAAAAIVAGAGMSALTSGVGLGYATPLEALSPAPAFEPNPNVPIPAEKCWKYGRVGAGSPRTGGGIPVYLPQCPVGPAPPPPAS